jgi:hypothetical protein
VQAVLDAVDELADDDDAPDAWEVEDIARLRRLAAGDLAAGAQP